MLIPIVWCMVVFFSFVCFVLWSSSRAAKDGYPADMDLEPGDPFPRYCEESCMRASGGASNFLNTVCFEDPKCRAIVC